MKLSIRRTAQIELTLREAAVIQQVFNLARDTVDWQVQTTGMDGTNEISRLGMDVDDVLQCIDSFSNVYRAMQSEDEHCRAFDKTKLSQIT